MLEFIHFQNEKLSLAKQTNVINNLADNNINIEQYPQMRFVQNARYRMYINFKPEIEDNLTKLAENIREAIWECRRDKTYTQEAYEKSIERYLINNPKVTLISHGVIQKIDQYGNPWKEWYDDKSLFDEQGLLQQPTLNFIAIQGTVYAKFVPLKSIEQLTEESSNETLDKVLSIGAILLGAAVLVVATVATAGAVGAMAGTIAASYGISAATATAAATGVGYGIAGLASIDAINSSVEVATGTNYIAKGLYNAFGNENTTEQDFINGYRNVSDFVHMAGWTYVTFGTYAMGSGYGSQKSTDSSVTKENTSTNVSLQKSEGSAPTGTVWDNIKATQDNYPNTNIPRSFEVEVNGQKMWVHGNASKHMYEDVYAKIMAGEGTAYTNPNLYTQELMSDFYGSLEQATVSGIKYGELISAGNWEFIFAPPRQEGLLPVIKHAQFNGW